jgi:hypothetical protein
VHTERGLELLPSDVDCRPPRAGHVQAMRVTISRISNGRTVEATAIVSAAACVFYKQGPEPVTGECCENVTTKTPRL